MVELREMDGATYGYQYGDRIFVNSNLIENGCFVTLDEDGEILGEYTIDAPGWNVYDTICHEDEHGAQMDRGEFQTRASYIESKSDYNLYRIQPDEARAFEAGQARTLGAIDRQINYWHSVDPDMRLYMDDVRDNQYNTSLEAAMRDYADENIENTMRQFVYDKEHRIQRQAPTFSYQSMDELVRNQQSVQQSRTADGQVSFREDPGAGYIPRTTGATVLPDSVEDAASTQMESAEGLSVKISPEMLCESELIGADQHQSGAEEDGSKLLQVSESSEGTSYGVDDGSWMLQSDAVSADNGINKGDGSELLQGESGNAGISSSANDYSPSMDAGMGE